MAEAPRPRRPLVALFALIALVVAGLLAGGPAGAGGTTGGSGSSAGARYDLTAGEAGSDAPVPLAGVTLAGARIRVTAAKVSWSDVGQRYWARTAIDFVGAKNNWMRDYERLDGGRYPFKPKALERRKLFFRAMVRAFAPNATPKPSIQFTDLEDASPYYRYASIAVDRGWTDKAADGGIDPNDPITMSEVHRAIVLALHLRRAAAGLNDLQTADGVRFKTSKDFGTTVIGMRLGLRYNHSKESLEVGPRSPMPRAEVAWSLYRAKTVASYVLADMKRYENIQLPKMSDTKRKIVQFGIRYAGYPYVWGGEWPKPRGSGYCCGAQPVGGFDCSGLIWWIMKAKDGSWDNTPPRPYRGWSLPQRASRDMASYGKKIRWKDLQIGDLAFYDGDGDGTVDHANVYIGNGWALDSSSGVGGMSIMWVGTGWYRDNFTRGRDIIG